MKFSSYSFRGKRARSGNRSGYLVYSEQWREILCVPGETEGKIDSNRLRLFVGGSWGAPTAVESLVIGSGVSSYWVNDEFGLIPSKLLKDDFSMENISKMFVIILPHVIISRMKKLKPG